MTTGYDSPKMLIIPHLVSLVAVPVNASSGTDGDKLIAAAASEPEANERSSSLISRILHYRGLQSLFLTKRKKFWLCANGRFRMRSGMRKELWICANGNILGCAVIWCNELWLCANG